MLKRVASRAGDEQSVETAEQILAQENAAARRLHSLFDEALDATLQERALAAVH